MRRDYENDKDNSNSINIVKDGEMMIMIKIIRVIIMRIMRIMRIIIVKVIMFLIVIN